MNDWERPETTPYPRIYSRFKGKKPMPDGSIPDFWVQDATVDMADEIADHMATYFMKDESIMKSLKAHENTSEEFRAMSKEHMRFLVSKRLSVAAMTDWPDGTPHLAGVNVLYVFRKGDEINIPEIPDENARKMISIMFLTLNMVDVYKKYGVKEFTTAVGLSVNPDFRGQNLGVELLKARVEMTRVVGLRLTLNNFTGYASQIQAERAGYELLADVPYKDIKDENGDEMFPDVDVKTLQFRVKYVGDENERVDKKEVDE